MAAAATSAHSGSEHSDGEHSDGDERLDPAAALALLTKQQLSITTQRGSFVSVITAVWGVVWLIGFLVLWLVDAMRPEFSIPLPIAIGVFAALMVIGIGVSAVVGVRGSRGIKSGPNAAFTGTAYGLSWWLGIIGIPVLGGGLQSNGMSADLANIYYPAAYLFFVGVMFFAAGTIWRAIPAMVTGVWMVAIAIIGSYFGHPDNLLFYAITGGGGFLVLAVWDAARNRRIRRATSATAASGA
ncbi:MAG: hypothetical protein QOF79_2608 [Actinomycetota bacterium]|jgi:hypothetical protein|nr:hypothetical protein [Actinomycetota bacterium]